MVQQLIRSRAFGPILAFTLAFAACAPFLPSFTSPWSPQGASASTPEAIARGSVPVAGAVNQAAQVGELVPGVAPVATAVDRYTQGYLAEIQRQIAALDAKVAAHQADPSKPAPTQMDWWMALGLAGLAGGSNVFSFNRGRATAARGTN